MIEFKILKKSKKSRARLGILKTIHGEVETPCLVTVATHAVVKTLDSEEIRKAKSRMLIANTFHLHQRPGEKVVKKMGGVQKFMNWPGPVMTDSGGFQVFSLGFGKDFGTGKILKTKPLDEIKPGQQPKLLEITNDGVIFRSYVDGAEMFLGPRESIKIQEDIGADIIFAFDECTSPLADYDYTKASMDLTHKWAKICLGAHKTSQALFGIVQGGKYRELRQESAKFIGSLPFSGFGIGGEFGDDKKQMSKMLGWALDSLPVEKPRHLLGIGYPEDMPIISASGIDTFDCIAPTHYARRGVVFISAESRGSAQGLLATERLDLTKPRFLNDKNPIDRKCDCYVCQSYSRAYLAHLLRAREITPLKLLTFHNLYFFNTYAEKLRENIKRGKI